jgi:hypothetical protein
MTELAGPPQRVIPDELVVADFDYFNLPGASRCPHGAIARLLDGLPIFHTPIPKPSRILRSYSGR